MEKIRKTLINEKGSITLYVLIAMILFLMIILFFYMQISSKNSMELQQLKEIQKEYESSDIDGVYQEEELNYRGEVIVTFYTPDGEKYDINEWTNQDIIVKIIYPYDVKDEDKYYYVDGQKKPYTDNEVIKENCTIATEYEGKEQEIHITKIDKTPATVKFNKNGEEYILGEGETEREISTTITADDGKGIGVQKVEYQITSSTTEPLENSKDWKEIENGETIKENKLGGTYYVYVKVTDNVGNVEIYRSNKFEVKYQVIFDVNGGTGTITRQVKTHGNSLTLTTQEPSKAGYEFIGWGTSKDDETVDYEAGGTYIENKTIRLYAIYKKTITGTFNYYDNGPKSITVSEDAFNDQTTVEITAPEIAKVERDGITLTGRGWSTDDSQTANIELKANEKVTISANSTYFASYSGTVTGTFNYYDGSKQAKETSSATRYMNYEGTYTQNNIPIPEKVTESKGPANTTYSHVSTTKTGEGETPNTELGVINYYTVYKKTVTATLYTYNNQKTTKTGTAYGYYDGTTANASIGLGTTSLSGYTARGWSTEKEGNANINVALNGTASILNDTTYYMSYTYTVTATLYTYNNTSSTKTGTAYMNYVGTKVNANINLGTTNLNGYTFRGWSTAKEANAGITVGANKEASINANTTYYASYTYTVTATYYYYNGSSYTSSKPTATAYMNYVGTKIGAKPTTPTVKNPSGWTARGWSTSSSATGTVATPGTITTDEEYYYSWQKTVTATLYTYNNQKTSKTGTAYLDYKGTTTNASIGLGTTTAPSGYTARGWSTAKEGNAEITVALNGTASILNDTTYYMSYSYTIKATFYYYDGSKYTSSGPTAVAYMNYEGTKIGGTPQAPAVKNPSGWTGRGWSTSSSATGEVINLGVITENEEYYYSWQKTVTATLYTYNNKSSAKTGTAYLNYAGSVTNASIGLGTTSLSGYTFRGWSTAKEGNAKITVAANGTASINTNTTYYASYSYTVTATYYYYNGSSYTSSKPTATAYMNYVGTKIGAKPTTPTVKNPSGWTARGWSTSSSATGTVATPGTITTDEEYYYSWQKTVTATLYTYNNQKTSKTGTAYLDYKGTTTNASIGLGTTTAPSGYTARGWSTAKEGNAEITVALNGTASILNDTTYYMSYSYTIKATFYYYDGSKYTSSGPTATAYMNYAGSKIGAKPTTPTVKNPSGWTGRGWSTSSSPTGTVATPGTITANEEYYYSWSKQVKLTYDANSGSGAPAAETKTAYLNYAGSITAASFTISKTTPTRAGWTFQNWNTSSNGSGTTYAVGGTIKLSENDILYAIWKDTTAPTITTYAGAMLYTDPAFASGTNSIKIYNNSGNGTVTHTRKAMSDNPAGSGYGIEIKTTGTASPGHGGFTFQTQTAAGKEYITRIVAKIPAGYNIDWASNAYGTGGVREWLTSTAGTGKWEEYAFRVKCGSTGSFSTSNYFYLKGGSTATTAKTVVWQVGYATVIDTSKWAKTNYIVSIGKDAQTGIVGYGLNQSSSTQPTYTSNTANQNVVKISNALNANGTYYIWMKDQTGNVSSKATTVSYIDTTAQTITTYAGAMLYTDPAFASGTNSIKVYNNSSNGTVTHTRKAMSDNPAGSGYGIEIKTTGTASPGHGGFYFATSTSTNKEYITRIVAKIPVGYNIEWASNAYGSTGTSAQWLTSTAGTGKWEEYAYRVKCGSTGTFSSTNFYYLKGGSTATTAKPVVWQVGYATVIDTSKWATTNYIVSIGKDTQSGVTGYGLNQSSSTQPTYTSNTANQNVVKISNALTANGTYYTWMKDAAGNYANKATTVKYIDRTAPTVALGTNGGTYTITPGNTTATISTKITATDTGGSGLSTSQYQLSTSTTIPADSDSNWKPFSSGGTISESKSGGTYYLYTKVTDTAGNRATSIQKSNAYTVNYQVKFDANGGSGAPGAQIKTHGTNLTLSSTKPTRTGYTFLGWSTSKTATSATYVAGGTYSTNAATTLYAVWKINSYTVTYNYSENGGTSATKTSATVNYNAAIDLTPTASKSGYTFIGWNTNKDATTKLTSLKMGTSNVTLYAIYSKTITATFNYYGDSTQVSRTVYNKTTSATIPSPAIEKVTVSGYACTGRGWSTSNAANATINVNAGANVNLSSNATYYASYSYTITATYYYYNGSSYTSSKPTATGYMNYVGTKIGAKPTTPTVKNPSGWSARGWSTSSSATGTVATPGIIKTNATYYYSWSKSVKLTFDANGGSGAPTAQTKTAYLNYAGTVTQASFTISTSKPTRTWYIFQNWNTASGGTGTKYSPGGTIKLSANDTLYAIWKANPTASITQNPTALTVVAGNTGSFSLTATGNGSLTYQWYYNTSNSTSGGTAISGATSSTYSFTSSTAMSGRYYYCVVTSTVGSSTATATSTPVLLKVQAANYSILNAGKTVYYNTISTAITDAVSRGGDTGGGTIKVLNTVTDSSTASTNKTITINLNGKTLTRAATITTTGGTLTIKGSGTIYCSSGTGIRGDGGNLSISSATLKGNDGHVIYTMEGTSGTATINNSYVYSEGRSAMRINGTGAVKINSSYVYTPAKDKNAIYAYDGSKSAVTITDSTIANGLKNNSGEDGSGGVSAAISYRSTGNLTITDSDILAGPYSSNALTVYKPITVNLTGSTRMYTTNTSNTAVGIYIYTSGVTVNFNATGYFYCTGSYVAETSGSYSATYKVTKGHFVSRNHKYMFKESGTALSSYVSSSSAGTRKFVVMSTDRTKTYKEISGCYYYTKGV